MMAVTFVLAAGAAAQEAATNPPAPAKIQAMPLSKPLSASGIARTTVALLVVLGGLYGVSWYLKNKAIGGMAGKAMRRIQIVERIALDPKRSLLLVSVDRKEMLLGVGGEQITLLGTLAGAVDKQEPLT